jgi:PAS domain S-box-containing protein
MGSDDAAADRLMHTGLLLAMRHSDEPMILSDPNLPDNPVVSVNKAFEMLSGYSEAEIVGRNCRFLQGPATDRDTVAKMGACLRRGEGCVQWLVNYRRDGSMFWNLLFMSPVHGRDGRLMFFFANQHDLSGEGSADKAEFSLGVAHMAEPQQAEFRRVLETLGRGVLGNGAPMTDADRARALEATLDAARRVARLTVQLADGPAPASG